MESERKDEETESKTYSSLLNKIGENTFEYMEDGEFSKDKLMLEFDIAGNKARILSNLATKKYLTNKPRPVKSNHDAFVERVSKISGVEV